MCLVILYSFAADNATILLHEVCKMSNGIYNAFDKYSTEISSVVISIFDIFFKGFT